MKKIYLILFSAIITLLPKKTLAVEVISPGSVPPALSSGPTFQKLLANVINILLYVAGIASVIVIVIAGILYIVSAGSPERTKAAKDALLYAIIGLVISLSGFAIVNFVLKQF